MTPDQIRIVEWLKEEVPTLYPDFEKVVQLMEGVGISRDDQIVCVMRAGTSAR
jgi:3-mercaptopyruvate sulfurtransferase SseA